MLTEYFDVQARRMPTICREDVEDLVAEKALELLGRIVHGETDLVSRHPAEIVRYFSTVAKNALLNLSRRSSRRILPRAEDLPEWDLGESGEGRTMSVRRAPNDSVEGKEYALSLRECVKQLKPRSRRIWFLRVFCEMPSKQIAKYPEINLNASHVDVILQRCRSAVRECMRRRGHQPQDLPPGSFSILWEVFREDGDAILGGSR